MGWPQWPCTDPCNLHAARRQVPIVRLSYEASAQLSSLSSLEPAGKVRQRCVWWLLKSVPASSSWSQCLPPGAPLTQVELLRLRYNFDRQSSRIYAPAGPLPARHQPAAHHAVDHLLTSLLEHLHLALMRCFPACKVRKSHCCSHGSMHAVAECVRTAYARQPASSLPTTCSVEYDIVPQRHR